MKPRGAISLLVEAAIVGLLIATIRPGPILATTVPASAVLLTLGMQVRTPVGKLEINPANSDHLLGSVLWAGLLSIFLALVFLVGGLIAMEFRPPIFVEFLLFFPVAVLASTLTSLARAYRLISRRSSLKHYSLKIDWVKKSKRRDR